MGLLIQILPVLSIFLVKPLNNLKFHPISIKPLSIGFPLSTHRYCSHTDPAAVCATVHRITAVVWVVDARLSIFTSDPGYSATELGLGVDTNSRHIACHAAPVAVWIVDANVPRWTWVGLLGVATAMLVSRSRRAGRSGRWVLARTCACGSQEAEDGGPDGEHVWLSFD